MTRLLRSSRSLLGVLTLVPALAACDSITGTDDLGRAQSELDRNWDRFQQSAPLSYSYTVRISCDCPSDITRPVVVYVDRGSIEYQLYEDDGRPVRLSIANSFPSAEQLFDAIQDAIDRGADDINVQYNFTYGYPTSLYIDYDRRVLDEELSLTAWGLRRWD